MFVDNIVICNESKEMVEERWRCALERRGMKANGNKREYVCEYKRERPV